MYNILLYLKNTNFDLIDVLMLIKVNDKGLNIVKSCSDDWLFQLKLNWIRMKISKIKNFEAKTLVELLFDKLNFNFDASERLLKKINKFLIILLKLMITFLT